MSWPGFWKEINWKTRLLQPIASLVCREAARRYQRFQSHPPAVSGDSLVVVVGNVVVGGSGKTPFILWLGRRLQEKGLNIAVISRGYGGQSKQWPQDVNAHSDPKLVGDEPVLLAEQLQCPVVVSPKRREALERAQARYQPDVVISDDGLQHYALPRDLEVVLVDSQRRFGNGLCLPAGPLREPVERLRHVDFIVCNGGQCGQEDSTVMQLTPTVFRSVADPQQTRSLDAFAQQSVEAVAGIGNPQRFFDTLATLDIEVNGHEFPDHHRFQKEDFRFCAAEKPLLMTEKDAVKCRQLANQGGHDNWWYLQVTPQINEAWFETFYARVEAKRRERSQLA